MNGCCRGEAETGHHDSDCWWLKWVAEQPPTPSDDIEEHKSLD